MSANKRSVFLINKNFQLKFVGLFFGLSLFSFIIFYFSNLYFFHRFKSMGVDMGLTEGHIFFAFIQQQQNEMTLIFLTTVMIASSLMIIGGIWLSHKVAGPLYRLHQELSKMKEQGHLSQVHFRKGDFFPEIPEAFNQVVELSKNEDITDQAS